LFQLLKVHIGILRIPKVKSLDFAVWHKKPVSVAYLKQSGTLEQHTKYTSLYIYNINIYSSSSKGLKEFAPIVIHKLIHRFCVALHMEHVGTWNRLWNRPESYKFNEINEIAPTRLVVTL
tara:strand:+ start:245 stop:604 length:360 start_codon:yes stop_codon:yes gene_type:complete